MRHVVQIVIRWNLDVLMTLTDCICVLLVIRERQDLFYQRLLDKSNFETDYQSWSFSRLERSWREKPRCESTQRLTVVQVVI